MTWYERLDKAMEEYLPDLSAERDVPMSRYTSFRIGGPARRVACPKNREQLVILMGLAQACGAHPFIIGNGTNLLVTDEGLDRLIIRTAGEMNAVKTAGENMIEADAGISLARLALFAQGEGLTGLEFAHGIPGSLGGAIFMNAGAYGGEMKQVVAEVTVLTEDGIRRIPAEDCNFGYRHSIFSDGKAVILGAKLRLQKGDPAAIRGRMEDLMEYPSAGSTCKRPEGYFAGTLIQQTGLKGLTVGGAQVSEKHAGFIINRGGATCQDVLSLIRQVQDKVMQAQGVFLEPEVRIIES